MSPVSTWVNLKFPISELPKSANRVLDLKTCQKVPLLARFQDEYVDPGSYRSGLVAARKVLVLRDYLESVGPPQHRTNRKSC